MPYIYEDRINKKDFIDALHKIYSMGQSGRSELGTRGMLHAQKNYNFKTLEKNWVELMDSIHERYGSWENRKMRDKVWELMEVA